MDPTKGFAVVDVRTGRLADTEKIALTEEWAKGLVYCDMEGFAVCEDGGLALMDECGKQVYCPYGRFRLVPLTDRRVIWRDFWATIYVRAKTREVKERADRQFPKTLKSTSIVPRGCECDAWRHYFEPTPSHLVPDPDDPETWAEYRCEGCNSTETVALSWTVRAREWAMAETTEEVRLRAVRRRREAAGS